MSAATVAARAQEAWQPEPLDRPVTLVTTVDIGEGRSGRIEVREGDDPLDVAWRFCQEHGLDDAIVGPLAAHIQENIDAGSEGGATDEPPSRPASARDAAVAEHCLPPARQAAAQQHQQEPWPPSLDHTASFKDKLAAHQAMQQQQQPEAEAQIPAQHAVRLERSRSMPQESPSKRSSRGGGGAAMEDVFSQVDALPTCRPASVNSAYGAQYWGTGKLSGPASARGGAMAYHSQGGVPAHDRLYSDYFKKQARLEDERRLRDLELKLKTSQVHVTPVSQQLAQHRIKGSYSNYGERLYAEGRIEAMRKEQEAQHHRQVEQEEEVAGLTFKPEISKLAKALKTHEQVVGGGATAPAYERLYYRSATAKRQERMEVIRQEQAEAEVAECTFRPSINDRSVRMVAQRQAILKGSGIAPYEQLYNDSLRRKLKAEAAAAVPPEEATFAPRINRSSVVLASLAEGRAGGSGSADGGESSADAVSASGRLDSGSADVATRLLERGRRYQEKLAAARKALEHPTDPATGRPLFQPETCRPPRFQRNPEGVPVGEYLYGIKAEWEERAAAVRAATEHRVERDASSTYVNRRSEALVDRLKRERFRAIFDYLRRGNSTRAINLLDIVENDTAFMDTIDPEVRADVEYAARILAKGLARRAGGAGEAPLTDSATSSASRPGSAGGGAVPLALAGPGSRVEAVCAQSMGGEVDMAGFVALMEEVLERSKGLSRAYLLPMPAGERRKFEEPSFHPAIDRNSQVLAARRRPDGLPAYEVLYETAKEIASKKESAKRALEAKALAECRFRPALVAAPLAKEGRAMKLAGADGSSAGDGSKHGSGDGGQPEGDAVEGEMVHIDALERQINEALVRLSLTGEQVAAHLAAAGQAAAEPERQAGDAAGEDAAAAAGVRASIDYRALFGSPSPTELRALSERGGASTMAGFNPLAGAAAEDEDAAAGAGATPVSKAAESALEWVEASGELVANVVEGQGQQCELAGLDLQALAGMDVAAGLSVPTSPAHSSSGAGAGQQRL